MHRILGGTTNTTNTYETEQGTTASTTGNVYGVYDMSGGANELTACFDTLGSSTYLNGTKYGKAMVDTAKDEDGNYISTKYVTIYTNGTKNNSSRADIIRVGKIGDATKEVRRKSSLNAWNEDKSYVTSDRDPFFARGGWWSSVNNAGVFNSEMDDGPGTNSGYGNTFRVVLAQ